MTLDLPLKDVRLNLPSASGYARLIACPGSFNLEQQFPRSEDTPESASGTRIHAYLAGETTELTAQERDTAEMCQRLADETGEPWDVGEVLIEQRLYMRKGLLPVFSGQPDRVYLAGKSAAILDFKTGWVDAAPSAKNPQLFALAILLHAERPELEQITAGIVQPSAGMKVELVTYQKSDLIQGEAILRAALELAKTATALLPGDHCKYCRALAQCPAANKEVVTLANMDLGSGDSRRAMLDNEMLFDLLTKCGPAEKMIGAIRAEAKRRIEAGEKIQGGGEAYVLTAGSGRRSITDAAKAFSVLAAAYDVTADDFVPCCTVKVGEVDTMIRLKTGMKAKDSKEAVNRALTDAGVLEVKASAPSLEKVAILENDEVCHQGREKKL